jgi:hypothetical protein
MDENISCCGCERWCSGHLRAEHNYYHLDQSRGCNQRADGGIGPPIRSKTPAPEPAAPKGATIIGGRGTAGSNGQSLPLGAMVGKPVARDLGLGWLRGARPRFSKFDANKKVLCVAETGTPKQKRGHGGRPILGLATERRRVLWKGAPSCRSRRRWAMRSYSHEPWWMRESQTIPLFNIHSSLLLMTFHAAA